MAITQIRHDTPGRAYYRRKRAAGKSHKEALRCLKRRLSDVVYRQLLRDAQGRRAREDTGGDYRSSAAGSTPTAGSSDKSLPGPASTEPTPPTQDPLDTGEVPLFRTLPSDPLSPCS